MGLGELAGGSLCVAATAPGLCFATVRRSCTLRDRFQHKAQAASTYPTLNPASNSCIPTFWMCNAMSHVVCQAGYHSRSSYLRRNAAWHIMSKQGNTRDSELGRWLPCVFGHGPDLAVRSAVGPDLDSGFFGDRRISLSVGMQGSSVL